VGPEDADRFALSIGGWGAAPLRVTFHEELNDLETSLQKEGELVVRSVQAATRVLGEQDLELADEVIVFDDEVDNAYFAIEESIQSLCGGAGQTAYLVTGELREFTDASQ
jgi:phosphate uptake regulator